MYTILGQLEITHLVFQSRILKRSPYLFKSISTPSRHLRGSHERRKVNRSLGSANECVLYTIHLCQRSNNRQKTKTITKPVSRYPRDQWCSIEWMQINKKLSCTSKTNFNGSRLIGGKETSFWRKKISCEVKQVFYEEVSGSFSENVWSWKIYSLNSIDDKKH